MGRNEDGTPLAGRPSARARSRGGRWGAALGIALLLAVGCSSAPQAPGGPTARGPDAAPEPTERAARPEPEPARAEPAPPARGSYDVLVVLFDSLRADHTEPYGAAAGTTPVLARLAAEGVTFTRARAPASWTRPSVASLLTSLSPTTHRIRTFADSLPAESPYLPEVLAAAGYHTVALTHSAQVAPALGFDRGFAHLERFYTTPVRREYFGLTSPEARAEFVWERGLGPALAAAGEHPWFVYLHELDPHFPYEPPAPYDQRYLAGIEPEPGAPTGVRPFLGKLGERLPEEDVARVNALYRGEVSFMDRFLGEILERLRAGQGDRRTLVVFLADHGESFGEHGLLAHGLTVYEDQLRVPMIWWLPGVLPAGLQVEETVDLGDVAPTLLDLLGLEAPDAMQGRSVRSAMRAGAPAPSGPRSFLAESIARRHIALRHGRWKLVGRYGGTDTPPEVMKLLTMKAVDPTTSDFDYLLFDLESDPGELHDLSGERPQVAADMRRRLAEEIQRLRNAPGGAHPDAPPTELDSETLEGLKALGYM